MHHLLGAVVVLIGVVGLGKRLVGIAGLHGGEYRKVARSGIVYRRSVGLHGVERIEHRLERLILDLYEACGISRDLLGGRADGGDLVAYHAHLFAAQRLFIGQLLERLGVAEVMTLGEVRAGQNALDAGHLQCLGKVDALNKRMRVGGVDELAVVHAGQIHVIGVDRGAGDLGFGIDADIGIALACQLIVLGFLIYALDIGVVFFGHYRHYASASFAFASFFAAQSIASTILA